MDPRPPSPRLCEQFRKMSWYLIPPKGHPDVDWDVFPEDIEFCDPDEQGFRGV